MEFKEREFIPLLFGGDINTYSVARAFYEEYGVLSYCVGKYQSGPSYQSKIVRYHANPKIEEKEVFLKTVNEFAKKHQDKLILLIGCGDSYVALASICKDQYLANVIAPYIDFDLMDSLQQKENFYQLCEKHGVDYPKTFVHTHELGRTFTLPFEFPVVVKPSNSISYWQHPFDGQDKVFFAHSQMELDDILARTYSSGNEEAMIIQEMVPGNDEYMQVLTSYSDRNAKVCMMCLGHVLLEEHTPHGLGNHAVIVTEYKEELISKVKNLLEEIGYIGYSNFDIKYDRRDGKYKFFEINTRQGRSNYYVTGSGFNIAKYLVEDYIEQKPLGFEVAEKEHLWMVVPKRVALRYVKEQASKDSIKRLYSQGLWVNPVFMKGDLKPKRLLRMLKMYMSHYVKYKRYYN